jgi:hypothetical protein
MNVVTLAGVGVKKGAQEKSVSDRKSCFVLLIHYYVYQIPEEGMREIRNALEFFRETYDKGAA